MMFCRNFVGGLGLGLAALLAACSPDTASAPPAAKSASPTNLATADAKPAATPSADSGLSRADASWLQILKDADPPPLPGGWETNKPGAAERSAFFAAMTDRAVEAADRARKFYENFPDHSRATEARLREYRHLGVATHFGKRAAAARFQEVRSAVEKRNLREEERFLMLSSVADRMNYLNQAMPGLIELADFEKEVRSLQKKFPRFDQMFDLTLDLAKARLGNDDLQEAETLASEIKNGGAPPEFKEVAESILSKIARLGKPLEMKFAALDGREVDLSNLRGKVTLIDGWATTCAICMAELPHIKGLYERLHPRGFEIVGVNFDDEKPPVDRLVAREGIAWPNYYDGKGYDNKFGAEFQITYLPMLWLVDKKGVLRDINGLRNLEEKIKKLLAE